MPRKQVFSAEIKAIERNVYKHLVQNVRQTYAGWSPITLNYAWTNALNRLKEQGKVVYRSDLGGWVPRTWESKLEKQNQSVLGYVKYRLTHEGKGTDGRQFTRQRLAALKRLQMGGMVAQHGEQFYPTSQAS